MIDLIIDLHISMFFPDSGSLALFESKVLFSWLLSLVEPLMEPLTHSRHTHAHTDSQDDTNKFSDQRSKARQLVTVMSREEHHGPGVVPGGWRCGRNKHAVVF